MSVIEFPGRGASTEERSRDEIHAETFRDLEHHICDCVNMAEIAAQCMSNAKCQDEHLSFSVFHLTEMLLNLKKDWGATFEGGDALTDRLIRHPAKTSREIKDACSSPPASELTPQHVLTVLFDSEDFPVVVPDPEAAAEIVVQRPIDSGFEIRPTDGPGANWR
jgi:hypothetical protein